MGVDSPMTSPKPPPIRTALEELDRLGFEFSGRSVWDLKTRRIVIGTELDWSAQAAPGMPCPRRYAVEGYAKRFPTLEEAAEALLEPRPGYHIHRVGKMRS